MKKFEDILSAVDNEVLNESTKKAIAEAFEVAVNEKVDARVTLEVEDAAKQLDE